MNVRRTVSLALGVTLMHGVVVGAHAQQAAGWKTDFTRHVVPLSEIVSGGPPKDGIPSIDEPRFTSVLAADRWIDDREPVMVVEHEGTVRVYPIQILIWHEIVNDRVADLPVAVTFCPLCNTALAFDRRLEGRVLDFGTTGRLRHSDMVMYDRQTESWWQQATGEGLVGEFAGRSLAFVPARMFDWAETKRLYPAAEVLSRDTGHQRRYGHTPYSGYDSGRGPIGAFFRETVDARLPALARVAAIHRDRSSVAYPFDILRERQVVNDTVAGLPIVVFWAAGAASALDAESIAEGRDVGSTAVFVRTLRDRVLRFEPSGAGRFMDVETGSTWTLKGEAIAGVLKGTQLEPVVHGDFFWFAWSVFRPDTRIAR